jgi:hypothetical protein
MMIRELDWSYGDRERTMKLYEGQDYFVVFLEVPVPPACTATQN